MIGILVPLLVYSLHTQANYPNIPLESGVDGSFVGDGCCSRLGGCRDGGVNACGGQNTIGIDWH